MDIKEGPKDIFLTSHRSGTTHRPLSRFTFWPRRFLLLNLIMSHSFAPVIDRATIIWTLAILLIGRAAILLKRRLSAQTTPLKDLDLSPAMGRVRACRVGWIEPGDVEVCLQLHELNAPNR